MIVYLILLSLIFGSIGCYALIVGDNKLSEGAIIKYAFIVAICNPVSGVIGFVILVYIFISIVYDALNK